MTNRRSELPNLYIAPQNLAVTLRSQPNCQWAMKMGGVRRFIFSNLREAVAWIERLLNELKGKCDSRCQLSVRNC